MSTATPDDDALRVALPDDPTAPAVARERTRSVVGSWQLSNLLEPLLLVVSELVGNAVRHGRAPIRMLLRRTGLGVRVEVHDESSPPERDEEVSLPDADAESGRGLYLVDAMSSETGVDHIEDDGKVVWATVEEPGPR